MFPRNTPSPPPSPSFLPAVSSRPIPERLDAPGADTQERAAVISRLRRRCAGGDGALPHPVVGTPAAGQPLIARHGGSLAWLQGAAAGPVTGASSTSAPVRRHADFRSPRPAAQAAALHGNGITGRPGLDEARYRAVHRQLSEALDALLQSGRLRMRLCLGDHRSHFQLGLAADAVGPLPGAAVQWSDGQGELQHEGFSLVHPGHLCGTLLPRWDLNGILRQQFTDAALGRLGLAPISVLRIVADQPLEVQSPAGTVVEHRDQLVKLQQQVPDDARERFAGGSAPVEGDARADNHDTLVAASYLLGITGAYDARDQDFRQVRRVGRNAVFMDPGHGVAPPPGLRDLLHWHPRRLLQEGFRPSCRRLFGCTRQELAAAMEQAEMQARQDTLGQLARLGARAPGLRERDARLGELHAHVQGCRARLRYFRD